MDPSLQMQAREKPISLKTPKCFIPRSGMGKKAEATDQQVKWLVSHHDQGMGAPAQEAKPARFNTGADLMESP